MMKRPMYKKGSKPKKKKSFPDMSGDGKITGKDFAMLRNKKKKKKKEKPSMMKKAMGLA